MPRSPVAGLGVGAGWRPAIAHELLARTRSGMRFSEVVAENVTPGALPKPLAEAVRAGLTVVPHGVTLGLAGADAPDPGRLDHLASLARALGAPLVSEHIAFVRAGAPAPDDVHTDVLEAGHLVPAARTSDALAVLVDNVRAAQDRLPVPLALENIAATLAWPESTMDEAELLTALTDATGCLFLLDVANLHATCSALGGDPRDLLDRMPLDHVAYVHVAGGFTDPEGVYWDTHAHDMTDDVLDLVTHVVDTLGPDGPPVLLERDTDVSAEVVRHELDRLQHAVDRAGLPA
ncbi:DUF692 domain-containing protein [Aeromicrobium sp. Root472D3]|uniref:DUF692 domain-containing protein n=1 Tax=Aeromicrobium sp. Root472D3 TaxID=1736540 RepID=UPI0006FB2454|nr:DUF692 domain-containing protein [Aeromicrobium sp. Root472D3]KQX76444.1 hypothetical protein ASD10_06815 [Aeromicrobium sp. Root472D3]